MSMMQHKTNNEEGMAMTKLLSAMYNRLSAIQVRGRRGSWVAGCLMTIIWRRIGRYSYALYLERAKEE